MRRHYIQEKGFKVIEIWECERWNCTKQPILLKNISENTFLTSVHLQVSNF